MTEPLRIVFAGTPEFAAEHLKALLASPTKSSRSTPSRTGRPAAGKTDAQPGQATGPGARHRGVAAADPARRASPGRTGGAQARLDGGGRLRPDPAASGAGYPAPGLHQQPRLAAAPLARCRADPARRGSRRCRERRDRNAHGSWPGHRADAAQGQHPISADDTGGSLHDRLALIGPPAVVQAIAGLAAGTLEGEVQDDSLATYAHKLNKDEARIDWSRPAIELERLVRAFNPGRSATAP